LEKKREKGIHMQRFLFLFFILAVTLAKDRPEFQDPAPSAPVDVTQIGNAQFIQKLAERGEPLARKLIQQGHLTQREAVSLKQELYTIESN
jgi:hypothetical protein